MKLWLITQDENNNWDTYDSAVVAAETMLEARKTLPSEHSKFVHGGTWCSHLKFVKVTLLGTAKEGTKAGVILGSFNAG